MEFLWENGTGGYVVGFVSEHTSLWLFMWKPVMQFIWEKNGKRLHQQDTSFNATLNKRYMVCINTYDNTFFIQFNKTMYYLEYTPVKPEKFRVYVANAARFMSSYIRMFFGNDGFENPLPPKFSSVIDRSVDYGITCRPTAPYHFNYMLISVFILV